MTEQAWKVGDLAVINRSQRVTVEKVTKSGRPQVWDRTFNQDGYERTRGTSRYRPDKLEHLTPEIEAEMALVSRGADASRAAISALDGAEKWVRSAFSSWNYCVPEVADVDRAERLVAAIKGVMEP